MRSISDLVSSDAAFSIEVLRLANSAMFGLRYEVVSILHAVSVLGINRLRGLILTVGLRDFLRSARHDEFVRRCWRHNLATALIGEWLAEPCWLDRGVAYTSGLLHDVGRLALLTLSPGRYLHVLQLYRNGVGTLLECERVSMGKDHCELGMELLKEWKLPATLTGIACEQHPANPETFGLPGLIAASCEASNRLGFRLVDAPESHDELSEMEEWFPPAIWTKVGPSIHELRELIPYKINVFECDFLAG